MLKKLKVKNYKSLKDFEIEFSKFNVLIGENAAGKSNILDCIEFLSEAIDNFSSAIKKRGGFKNILYDSSEDEFVKIETEFKIKEKNVKYIISFNNDEELNEDIDILDNSHIDDMCRYEIYKDFVKQLGSVLYVTPEKYNSSKFYDLLIFDREVRFYNAIVYLYSKGVREAQEVLSHEMKKNVETICDTVETLCNIFQCEKISLPLSDGFGKFVVLYYRVKYHPILLFEEIENTLHPKVIPKLVEFMKASDCQIISTTYSSLVLNYLEPEDIIYVKMTNDGTKAMKNPEKIKELCEKYQWKIGDLWEMGDLERLCFSQ